MRRWLAIFAVFALFAAGAWLISERLQAIPRQQRLMRERFDRIQPGMTKDEVFAIMGPLTPHPTSEMEIARRFPGFLPHKTHITKQLWWWLSANPDQAFEVDLDDDGVVIGKNLLH